MQLATIEAREETSCRTRGEQSRAVSLLWEEARKALAAASWNANQSLYRQTLLYYERDFDARRRRVFNEDSRFSSGLYEVPYRSIDPHILASRGYVFEDEQGYNWYYAPDANVLLDEEFHSQHCFRVVEGQDEYEGLLGLGFEPTRGLRQTDVEGTLWIDPESAELRELNYHYTRLPNGIVDDRVGGSVEFLRMPTGAWLVHRWQIRTPRVSSVGGRPVIEGFRDTGGEILVVTTTQGDSVYSAPMAHVSGVVMDSSQGEFPVPLRGALVSVVGTSFSAVTGSNGSFRLDAPLTGPYGVSFAHAKLDSLGIVVPEYPVELATGQESEVVMNVPTMSSIIAKHCDGHLMNRHRVVVGVVRDRYAEPIANAAIRAEWQVIPIINEDVIAVRSDRRETRSDENGRFSLCDIPQGPVITLSGLAELSDTEIEGSMRFNFEYGRDQVTIVRRDESVDSFYAPFLIWRADLALFPR